MNDFVPTHYKLVIGPDLEKFVFSGQVHVEGTLTGSSREIVLHAHELEIETCRVHDGTSDHFCLHHLRGDEEQLSILLPRGLQGRIALAITYRGRINDRMAGFYRSAFTRDGCVQHIALTQFQESDARRAFPCLDQPAAKATFDITLVVPNGLIAVSNCAVRRIRPTEDGRREVHFETTPPMSTYLVFWAVGPFNAETDREDLRVRALTLPGVSPHARFGLQFGRRALQFCEHFYRIPYPLPKMDLIAVPDFAFGAMENWGAITFRENLLLHFPGTTSKLGEHRICEVIAHEVAHQWFGNLVTPADWTYLWLNESFATYFGFKVVDHHRPLWQVWQQFLATETEPALARDELVATVPIEIPGGEHVVINESTAPIIYSKGGSILRQMEGYVGPEVFREGLHRYLHNHAYGAAASHHLWEALEEASHLPVIRMMRAWIEQPGHPLLEVRREEDRLLLAQRRFAYLSRDPSGCWPIPVRVRAFLDDGTSREEQVLLEDPQGEMPLPDGCTAYKVNAGQTGFYRVRYTETADLDGLGEQVQRRNLPAEDRWGLQSDLFALVLGGLESLDRYLEFLDFYGEEIDGLPLGGLARNLRLVHGILPEEPSAVVSERGCRLLEQALEHIGPAPKPDESPAVSILRDQILWDASVFGSQTARSHGLRLAEELRKGGSVPPDLRKAALQIGAAFGGPHNSIWLREHFDSAGSEHERINVLTALGAWRDPGLLRESLEWTLQEVPARIRFVPVVAAAANPWATSWLWSWFEEHVRELERLHPMLYERVLAAVIPAAGLNDSSRTRSFLERYVQTRPSVGDVVELSLERLAVYQRLAESAGRS